jgi:hypothetical protein
MDALHEFHRQAEWFAKHTPYPFKVDYGSYTEDLAELSCSYLQDLARKGNQRAITDTARLAVELTETLDDLLTGNADKVESNAKLLQYLAKDIPYWPTLQFKHRTATNHFPLLAQRLRLGAECLINVSPLANYSLQTPINRFVWRWLRHFKNVHWHIRCGVSHGKTLDQALAPLVFQRGCGMINRNEIPIYKRSFRLPPLSKSTAKKWVDTAIIPLLCKRYPDFSVEPVLKAILDSGNPKSRKAEVTAIRKAMRQYLHGLAKKSDKPRHS